MRSAAVKTTQQQRFRQRTQQIFHVKESLNHLTHGEDAAEDQRPYHITVNKNIVLHGSKGEGLHALLVGRHPMGQKGAATPNPII
jgi:hypothetical protein